MSHAPEDVPDLSSAVLTGPLKTPAPSVRLVKPASPESEPERTPETPAAAAEAVRGLNAMQLTLAQTFLFRLRHNHEDLLTVDRIAAEHPAQMAEARRLTTGVLGTAEEWQARAMKDWSESEWSDESLQTGSAARGLWNAMVLMVPLIVTGAVAHFSSNLAIGLAAGLLSGAVLLKTLARPADIGVPELHLLDVKQLQSFVAEAVLADALEAEGAITADEAVCLRRGWDHVKFIGGITTAMSMPPFDFITVGGQARKAA